MLKHFTQFHNPSPSPSPSPKSKVERTWSDSILQCHPPTTHPHKLLKNLKILFQNSILDCDIVESNSSFPLMLLCFRGLASEEIEKLSLNSIPDLMKGVVEDRNAIIGHSVGLELEIRINCTYPNGEKSVLTISLIAIKEFLMLLPGGGGVSL